eukprot:gene1362-4537_t
MGDPRLTVTVICGTDLKNVDKKGKSDPYVILELDGQKHKTKVQKDDLNPKWNETFNFTLSAPLSSSTPQLKLTVKDKEFTKDKLLGKCSVPLDVLLGDRNLTKYYSLQEGDGRIQLRLSYQGPVDQASLSAAPKPGEAMTSEEIAGKKEGREAHHAFKRARNEYSTKKADFQVRVRIIEARNLQGNKSLKPLCRICPIVLVFIINYMVQFSMGGSRTYDLISSEVNQRYFRLPLVNDLAKLEFIAGPSNFLSSLYNYLPLLLSSRTSVAVSHTAALSTLTYLHRFFPSANSPWFNELFYFNVHESPANLMDQTLLIQVFNSRFLGRNALIGSFSLDLALAYQQDHHHISKKWVMLTNPKDRASGCMGFVKFTMTIVGEGDEPPEEDPPTHDVDEDIEENLLRPPGVTLEAIDMCIRAFLGEDMPRMDTSFRTGIRLIDAITGEGDKQHCDPYVKADFAGRKARTSTQDNTYFPVWMEELHLPATIPSLADRLRIQTLDDDPAILLNDDDTIATTLLSLSEISHTDPDDDLGFLPTFGPCFVNFYGSTREYSLISSDHSLDLNQGKMEGCAYRGRILLEIVSQPGGDKLEKGMNKLDISEEQRIQPFQSRKAYFLRLELLDLNMLNNSVRGGFIRVEASIGNVGNVLESPDAQNSITAPTKPTFDGSRYYFVSWDNRKPCLELNSDWEDVDYRYQTFNFLRKLDATLDDIYHQYEIFKNEDNIEEDALLDLADDSILALQSFQQLCEQSLPSLPDGRFTRLDYQLFRLRTANIKMFHGIAGKMLEKIMEHGPMCILDICAEDLPDLKSYIADLLYEPQLSIPDVIIWILTDDNRRADIMFDENPDWRGKNFGQVQTKYMKQPVANSGKAHIADDLPAQLQFRAWFGDSDNKHLWPSTGVSIAVLSEVYENQRYMITKWIDPKCGRYTDITRKKKRPIDDVYLPPGWRWKTDWELAPEVVEFDPEEALDCVVEEIWENERYIPFKGWRKPMSHPSFSSIDLKESIEKDAFELDDGWAWEDQWHVDTARSCDHKGWAYGVSFASKTFFPAKKRIHCVRRRRWIRTRRRIVRITDIDNDRQPFPEEEEETEDPEGWFYAFSFQRQFHKKRRRRDLVRSRRWHRERELLPDTDPSQLEPLTEEMEEQTYSVGLYFCYPELQLYQVRIHLYQGRHLIGEDSSGLSDPYVFAICGHHSARSTTVKQSTCPLFDQ